MTSRQSASSLPSFAEGWVDGDIHGLQALASELYGRAFQITDAMATLDQLVSRLSPAVSMFASSWRRESVTAEALAAVIVQAAAIIEGLAVDLAAIENALEEKAYVASRYGVKIGTDGQPPPEPAEPQANVSERHWMGAYKLAHERAMTAAQQARRQAARQLTHLYEQIKPPRTLAMSSAGPEILTSFLHEPLALSRAVCPSVVKGV